MPTATDRTEAESLESGLIKDSCETAAANELIGRLLELRSQVLGLEAGFEKQISQLPEDRRSLAKNLLHYVALRRNDLRPLQDDLANWGLSSLGRCESYVLANLNALLDVLTRVTGSNSTAEAVEAPIEFSQCQSLIQRRTEDLLGAKPEDRPAHIMVTMPTTAGEDYHFVRDLLVSGMTCMRINTAHDSSEQWTSMIQNLRNAENETGHTCRVIMDLAGPKLRTGEIEPGPCVLKWRPKRDQYGRVTVPARIWLYEAGDEASYKPDGVPGIDVSVPIENGALSDLHAGNILRLRDARGRLRKLTVVEVTTSGVRVESNRTGYVTAGTSLYRFTRPGTRDCDSLIGQVGSIPPLEQAIPLRIGDRMLLSDDEQLGQLARYDEHGQLLEPARIGCTLPSVFNDVQVGERILFDDGKIESVILAVCPDHLVVEVTGVPERGAAESG